MRVGWSLKLSMVFGSGAFLMIGCTTLPSVLTDESAMLDPPRTVFEGRLTYPTTEISVSETLRIRHRAMPADHRTEAELEAEGAGSTVEGSEYDWIGDKGRLLLTVPSMLTLPTPEDGEYESYLRDTQSTRILASSTGRTFVIAEDRSIAYPVHSHTIVQVSESGDWRWFSLILPFIKLEVEWDNYPSHPRIVGVEDEVIWLSGRGVLWSESIMIEPGRNSLKIVAPPSATGD